RSSDLLTFSRTALLASGTATLTMAAITGRARRFLPFAVVIAIAGALIPAVRFQFLATFVSGTSQQLGVFERYALVTEALHIWREHPLFGIGFGQFEHFANVSRLVEHGGFLDATVGSVHNEYVTTLLKGGLLVASGFVAALVMAFRVFRRAVRSPVAEVRILGLASIGIAVSLTIAGLTAESFRTLSVSAPFWALIGALSVPQPNRGSGKSATHIVPDRPWREAR